MIRLASGGEGENERRSSFPAAHRRPRDRRATDSAERDDSVPHSHKGSAPPTVVSHDNANPPFHGRSSFSLCQEKERQIHVERLRALGQSKRMIHWSKSLLMAINGDGESD